MASVSPADQSGRRSHHVGMVGEGRFVAEALQRSDKGYYYVTATKLDTAWFDFVFVSTPQGDYWIPATDCPSVTLALKQHGDEYVRNITRPGKYEVFRVESC